MSCPRSTQRRDSQAKNPSAAPLRWGVLLLSALSILSLCAIATRGGRDARVRVQGAWRTQDALSLRADNATIPRIIHQSWKTPHAIPARFQPWMRSWVAQHPTWTYVFWTDEDNLRLFERLYPEYLAVAKAVGKISLADMARYALLHRVGGLYVDADFECKQPFDDLHEGAHRIILSSEPLAHTVLLEGSDEAALCNALMASVPGHPFWLRVLDNIKAKFDAEGDHGDAVALTGPRIVKDTYFSPDFAFSDDDSDIAVFPQEYFYPEVAYWNLPSMQEKCEERSDPPAEAACDWLNKFPHGQFTANTHATHHWQCTWCLGDRSDDYVSLADVLYGMAGVVARPDVTSSGVRFYSAFYR
ncbi:hypothetical protein BBJ28_00012605 [Nothophytophthora sp. Chile5]|nr:hypothetical protein BBJ28_00012605 [Nothophytophthora sp. Chile5]